MLRRERASACVVVPECTKGTREEDGLHRRTG